MRNRWTILATVFTTGAAALAIEVVALRALAPFFGNTIFVSSSVIGIVLLALSLGYFFGGRLADRQPHRDLFDRIVAAAGVATLLIVWIGELFLPQLARAFSIASGPPLAALILLFLPGLLLGMVSPFAIRLLHDLETTERIGRTSGDVFFWSTLGSIVGALGAAYLLIPFLAIPTILTAVGTLLLFVGGLPLIFRRQIRSPRVIFLLVSILIVGNLARLPTADDSIVYQQNGLYEQITIVDGELNDRPVRFLELDANHSSARYLDGDDHVFDYTRYVALHRFLVPDLGRALVLGGGAYTIPRALLAGDSDVQVDVVDIEPRLYPLAQQYFGLVPDSRLRSIVADGRRFLADTTDRYDFIFSDVYYTLHSIPPHFTTREFLELVRTRLTPEGAVIVNLIGTLDAGHPSFVTAEIKTFLSVFSTGAVYAVYQPDAADIQNVILVGTSVDAPIADVASDADPFFRDLPTHRVDLSRLALTDSPLLSDRYAPIEYMMAQTLRRFR